jgi:5'(3')-deoxyribonucleotidase
VAADTVDLVGRQKLNDLNWPEVLRIAQKIAIEAHKTQLDKLGYAYIGHPRRVARNAQTVPVGEGVIREAVIAAAWLHDVIEDSPNTKDDLIAKGIPAEVAEAVELVSDPKTGDKDEYYANIAKHPLARAVKLADIADNSNVVRTKWLVDSGVKFNHDKYPHALEVIGLNEAEQDWFDKQVLLQPDRIIYIDMDNVIVDFETGINKLSPATQIKYPNCKNIDDEPGIFALMEPYEDSVAAVKKLAEHNEVYILSTAPWDNPSAWSDKLEWVHRYFGKEQFDEDGNVNWLYKRLIISHNKHLNKGEYLIDDRLANGAGNFKGIHVHFGPADIGEKRDGSHPDWSAVLAYFEAEGLLA